MTIAMNVAVTMTDYIIGLRAIATAMTMTMAMAITSSTKLSLNPLKKKKSKFIVKKTCAFLSFRTLAFRKQSLENKALG